MTSALVKGINVCFVKPDFSINKIKLLLVLSIALLSSALLCHQFPVCGASPPSSARVSPLPPVYIAEYVGEVFEVGLEVSGVENLHSASFIIAYDSVLLSVQQVSQSTFFPSDAWFHFEINETAGLVELEMSLSGSNETVDGTGVLAELTFKIQQASPEIAGSTVRFLQLQLYDLNHEELNSKSVGAILFWQSVSPSEPDGERRIDLYTQKGGIGLGEFGGWFGYGDVVTLKAYVTYEDWPQQNVLVAFQVINPLNETVLVLVDETDENGIAGVSFGILEVYESVGLWTAISSVDVACEIVWDTLTFRVSSPVGGETTAIEQYPGHYIYFAVVGILALSFAASKRVFRGSSEQSFSVSSRLSIVRAKKILLGNVNFKRGIT